MTHTRSPHSVPVDAATPQSDNPASSLPRRNFLTLPALVAIPTSAAFTAAHPISHEKYTPIVITAGVASASTSGAYSAQLQKDGNLLRPLILDNARFGETVWEDSVFYVLREPPIMMWESEVDVLWLLSPTRGNARVTLIDGQWTKTVTSDGMPPEVAEHA